MAISVTLRLVALFWCALPGCIRQQQTTATANMSSLRENIFHEYSREISPSEFFVQSTNVSADYTLYQVVNVVNRLAFVVLTC